MSVWKELTSDIHSTTYVMNVYGGSLIRVHSQHNSTSICFLPGSQIKDGELQKITDIEPCDDCPEEGGE